MLFPKKSKFRKMHRRDSYRKEYRVTRLTRGNCGIKALESGRLTSKQLESSRKAIVKKLRRFGKVLIRVFPDISITSKPTEVRMGKGKGSFDYWCSNINSGRILFEFLGVPQSLASEAAKIGQMKLPMRTKLVYS